MPEKEIIFEKAKKVQQATESRDKSGVLQKIRNFMGIDRDFSPEKEYTEKILKKYPGIRSSSLSNFDYPFLYYWLGDKCLKNDIKCKEALNACRVKKARKGLEDDCEKNQLGDVFTYCSKNKCKRHEEFFDNLYRDYKENFRPFYKLSSENPERFDAKDFVNNYLITLNRTTPGAFDIFYLKGNKVVKQKIYGAQDYKVLKSQIDNNRNLNLGGDNVKKLQEQKFQQISKPLPAPPAKPIVAAKRKTTPKKQVPPLPPKPKQIPPTVAAKQQTQSKKQPPSIPPKPCTDDAIIYLLKGGKSNCKPTQQQQKFVDGLQEFINREKEIAQRNSMEVLKLGNEKSKIENLLKECENKGEQSKDLENLKNLNKDLEKQISTLKQQNEKIEKDCKNCQQIANLPDLEEIKPLDILPPPPKQTQSQSTKKN